MTFMLYVIGEMSARWSSSERSEQQKVKVPRLREGQFFDTVRPRPRPLAPLPSPARHRPLLSLTAAPRSPQRVGPPPRPLPPPRVALTPRLCGACAGLSCGGAAAWRTGRTTPAAPRTPPRTAAGASFIIHTLPHTLPHSPISPTTPIIPPLHFHPSPAARGPLSPPLTPHVRTVRVFFSLVSVNNKLLLFSVLVRVRCRRISLASPSVRALRSGDRSTHPIRPRRRASKGERGGLKRRRGPPHAPRL